METEAKLPLKLTHGWNTNSSSLFWGFYFWTECSTRSQWIFFPALTPLSFLSGLLMVFRAPSKLPFCFAVFKYLLPFSRQAWIIDLRLPKLLYRKRKTLLKIWMLLHSDRCHLSSERLAQKLNHWGCASVYARKSHAPLWGAELGFMTEVLLYSDLVIHWLDCLSDFFTAQCWQASLRWMLLSFSNNLW